MRNLDDLAVFHAVVTRGSFTAAAESLGLPKATVSKRLARLEAQLAIRLLQRSTRRLRLTEIGEAVFAHAEVAMGGLAGALAAARDARTEPVGTVILSCPQGLMRNLVGPMLHRFLLHHPKVSLDLRQRNRPVDLIEEGIDIALRVRSTLTEEGALVVRRLGVARSIIVASPSLLEADGSAIAPGDLAAAPLLSVREHQDWWPVEGEHRGKAPPTARLLCEDFTVLLEAAISGLGAALIPEHVCRPALSSGKLVRLFPHWNAEGVIHAVFPSRRGLPPATRSLLDHLASEFAGQECR